MGGADPLESSVRCLVVRSTPLLVLLLGQVQPVMVYTCVET
jgi:hypothetical protein